jgi:tripartite-type tricarboxylate transporter receptor subunit TctC
MFAPARTPWVLINRLQQETTRVLARSDVRERFVNSGAEPVGSSPEEFARQIKSEMARLGPVIKNLGIRAN